MKTSIYIANEIPYSKAWVGVWFIGIQCYTHSFSVTLMYDIVWMIQHGYFLNVKLWCLGDVICLDFGLKGLFKGGWS